MANGKNKDYFIDSHLHLFNIDHIPIFTLLARLNLNLIKIGALFVDLNKLRDEFEKFFTYFESDITDNIEMLTDEIDNSLNPIGLKALKNRDRILTPLIMDFEKISGVAHEKLKNQTQRLVKTLRESKVVPDNYKILPFLGLDPRRFKSTAPGQIGSAIDNLIEECAGGLKPKNQRENPARLQNGDIIGIKLYPPIGFDPYPEENNALKKKYLAVFRHIHKLGLPLTVHCQRGSYQPNGVSSNDLEQYTNPVNWGRVLKEDGLADLRVNFAHFGGEDSVKDTVAWEKEAENVLSKRKFEDLNKSTWTYTIINLLKQYKNAYADISAFNYRDKKATLALAWILALDHTGELDNLGQHRLSDKLLWGSDYPMPIREQEFNNYTKILSEFYKAIDLRNLKDRINQSPNEKFGSNKLPDRQMLLNSMTNLNPARLLFGG